jgi:hypothetical protein
MELMEKAGLKDLFVEVLDIDVKDEAAGIFRRYGFLRMMQIMGRTFMLYLRNSAYREFTNELKQQGVTPDNLSEYFGYGIYVGRK